MAPQPIEREHVAHLEFRIEPALRSLRSGQIHRSRRYVDAQHCHAAFGHEERVLAGPAAAVEDRRAELSSIGQLAKRLLRPADVPRWPVAAVHSIPGGPRLVRVVHDFI